jgi:hypothetical protein
MKKKMKKRNELKEFEEEEKRKGNRTGDQSRLIWIGRWWRGRDERSNDRRKRIGARP